MNDIEAKYANLQKKALASQPHEQELNDLIKALESTMVKIIVDLSISDLDANLKEDLMQEGRLSVCKAVAAYSKDNNSSFYTFVYLCIKNSMLDYLRKQNTKKNAQMKQAVSLDSINESEIASSEMSLEDLFDNEDKIKNLLMNLDDTQKKIIAMRIEGNSYEEIAKALNKNTKFVDNAIQKIKKIYKTI